MKRKVLLLTILFVIGVALYAQVPQAITLQSVLRDASGHVVANQNIAVRLTLMQGSATGTPVYIETHTPLTNPYGLYSVLFGQGTPVQGDFGGIDWGGGPYFLVVEADPMGGTSYSLSVVQPIVSVPYALYANTAAHVVQAASATNATHAAHADNAAYAVRSQAARLADTAQYYQERQILTMGHDTIYLTGGSFVVLPAGNGATVSRHYVDSVVNANNTTIENNYLIHISDSVRMMQDRLRDSVIIFHSDSNHARYADTAQYYQERQILTMGHDTIYLTGGSFVVLPASNGATVSHHYVDSMVNANNTIVENSLLDSVRQLRNTLRDSIVVSLRDSIVTVLRDSAAMVQRAITSMPADICYASCSSIDSLRRINDSIVRAFDSVMHRYDSLIAKLYHRVDSAVNTNPVNPPLECPKTYFTMFDTARIDTARMSYTWSLNGQTYTASTTVSKILVGANACGNDSIVTLHLTIFHHECQETYCTIFDTACERYTWPLTGHIHTASVDDTMVLRGANACGNDSIVVLHLTINGTHNREYEYYVESYTWHGNTYDSTGTYIYKYINAAGCPSVDTLFFTALCRGDYFNDCCSYFVDKDTICWSGMDGYNWRGREISPFWVSRSFWEVGEYYFLHPDTIYVHSPKCDSLIARNIYIEWENFAEEVQVGEIPYTWHGNTYVSSGTYTYSYTSERGCHRVDTLHLTILPEGALPGVFSVSSTQKVRFSKGNLQYTTLGSHRCADGTTKSGTWRFAEHQYDIIGDDNKNISSSYTGWIDLFGWGTSGYHDPADPYNVNYHPYSSSDEIVNETYNYYGYGPSENMPDTCLEGSSKYYDWGQYNAISNGGNEPGLWKTLSCEELVYLMQERSTSTVCGCANARFCDAQVNGVYGIILFPDNYTHSASLPILSSINTFHLNIINSDAWAYMENAGCVFLPYAGSRFNKFVSGGTFDYQLSTRGLHIVTNVYLDEYHEYCIFVHPSDTYPGYSVRLVIYTD